MEISEIITPGNVTFAIGILGVIFTIYNYFRNPQIKTEQKDALQSQEIKFMCESNDRRFLAIQERFDGMLLQSNNHIHTVDTKVETLTSSINDMGKEITKLATIIDERIPKKIIKKTWQKK
jgi:hypothetical protein